MRLFAHVVAAVEREAISVGLHGEAVDELSVVAALPQEVERDDLQMAVLLAQRLPNWMLERE